MEGGGKTTWTLSTKFIRANWARGRRTRAGPFSVLGNPTTVGRADVRVLGRHQGGSQFSTSFEGTLDTRARENPNLEPSVGQMNSATKK